MARPTTLRIMLSSRSKSAAFGGPATLTDVRTELKGWLEGVELFGEPLFEVWIHEDAAAADATADAWEESIAEIRRADLVLALYNGEAGWAVGEGDVGICHAELQAARASAPGKVFVLPLEPLAPPGAGDAGVRDGRFRDYAQKHHPFAPPARNADELRQRVADLLREAVANLARLGVAGSRRGRWASGEALDWSRLDLRGRKAAMEDAAYDTLVDRHGVEHSPGAATPAGVALRVAGRDTLFVCHGLPATGGTAAARELVGQPFLRDHERVAGLPPGVGGPVHVVLCHRSATEAQALRMLGHPDATVVSAPFGVYLADEIQKVQIVLVAECRDPTATRHGLQRLFVWLDQAAEGDRLAARAAARRRIAEAIAAAQQA